MLPARSGTLYTCRPRLGQTLFEPDTVVGPAFSDFVVVAAFGGPVAMDDLRRAADHGPANHLRQGYGGPPKRLRLRGRARRRKPDTTYVVSDLRRTRSDRRPSCVLAGGLTILVTILRMARTLHMNSEQTPAMAAQTTRQVIDRFNEAFNRHDADALASLLTDDAVFEDTSPPPDGRRIEGKAAVVEFWRKWFTRNTDAVFRRPRTRS
jgi:SnoaL-like domain